MGFFITFKKIEMDIIKKLEDIILEAERQAEQAKPRDKYAVLAGALKGQIEGLIHILKIKDHGRI